MITSRSPGESFSRFAFHRASLRNSSTSLFHGLPVSTLPFWSTRPAHSSVRCIISSTYPLSSGEAVLFLASACKRSPAFAVTLPSLTAYGSSRSRTRGRMSTNALCSSAVSGAC